MDCQGLDSRIPDEARFMATVEDGMFKGNLVTAATIPEVLKEMGVSIQVLIDYRNEQAKISGK